MTLKLSRTVIRDRAMLVRALSAFPNARRVILDLGADHQSCARSRAGLPLSDADDDTALVGGALDALATTRHPLTSLAILHLSRPLSLPAASTLSYLASCGLAELDLHDASIERCSQEGASNLLRSLSRPLPATRSAPLGPVPVISVTSFVADSIRARGTAMVQLARTLPTLKRLSLCCAAFPAADVAALAALPQLEELSVVGAMECGGCHHGGQSPSASAIAVHQRLLAALPRLRRLQLPLSLAAPPPQYSARMATFLDDDGSDEEGGGDYFAADEWDTAQQEDYWGFIDSNSSSDGGSSNGSSDDGSWFRSFGTSVQQPVGLGGRVVPPAVGQAGSAPSGWSFPPTLTDLTIPLCSLNGPVFRAACEAYGRDCSSDLGRDKAGSSGRGISSLFPLSSAHDCHGNVDGGRSSDSTARGLRALHIPCAPGYTMWEGSFLTADRDFEALSRLASLETLHLSLELGSSGRDALRRDGLRACFQHLKALHCLKDLRICSAQQPVCFSARKRTCGQVDNLLSYVLGTDGQAAAPQISIRLPILPPLGGRNVRPRPTVSWQPAASPFHGWPPAEPPRPSAPALTGLLVHWPQLQTLVVAEQSAFRTSRGGKDCLVAPASLEELVALREAHVAS